MVRDRRLGGQVEVEYWEDPKLSEVIARAGSLPPDTVVLDMAFLASDAGKPLGLLSSTRKASEALGVPIYSCWETLLGNGIVGGMICGGFQQGEAAGKLALQVLRGADADTLPVVRKAPIGRCSTTRSSSASAFPRERLPPDSIVINRPATLYERYRGMLWAFVTAIAALAVLLVLSWLYIVSQQRLKRGLRRSEERLSLALASTASGIWEYHPKTRKAYYDSRWFTMLGYEPGALPPEYGSWADLLHPDDRAQTERDHPALTWTRERTSPWSSGCAAGTAGGSGSPRAARWWSAMRRAACCASSAPTWTSASASAPRRSWSRPT